MTVDQIEKHIEADIAGIAQSFRFEPNGLRRQIAEARKFAARRHQLHLERVRARCSASANTKERTASTWSGQARRNRPLELQLMDGRVRL